MQNTSYLMPQYEQTVHIVKGYHKDRVIKQNPDIRESIIALESEISSMDDSLTAVDYSTIHHFAPNVYLRQIFLPKGHTVIGQIHRHSHLNVIVKGFVTVTTEEGVKDYRAGDIFTSDALIKRAVYCHEDSVWVTIHPTDKTNLDEIESVTVAKSFEELEDTIMLEGEQ